MLNRQVVKEFLEEALDGIEIPQNILLGDLVEAFCRYVEDDYYEWIKDNVKSFFDHGKPSWYWIRERIEHYSEY